MIIYIYRERERLDGSRLRFARAHSFRLNVSEREASVVAITYKVVKSVRVSKVSESRDDSWFELNNLHKCMLKRELYFNVFF